MFLKAFLCSVHYNGYIIFMTFYVFLFLRFFPGTQALGEIYSLACDTEHLITGHTLNTSAFKVWRIEDFEEVKTIKVSTMLLCM